MKVMKAADFVGLKCHLRAGFRGSVYWLHCDEPGQDYLLLSPLHHFTEDGRLLADPFRAVSYATVQRGMVLRHGAIIGYIEDIEIMDTTLEA
jgi:hypothetical protein